LYLGFASQYNLPPVESGTGNPDEEIKKIYRGRSQTCNSFITGRKLVDYLLNQCNSGARIEYSPVTKVELVCGQLKGMAMLDAADEGIPHRMWNRIDEFEIIDRLRAEVYQEVQQSISEIENQLRSAGIDIFEADPERMKLVWSMALQVLGFVFLDLGDCAVYASALLAEADEIITGDRYFRYVVNENAEVFPDENKRLYFQQAKADLRQIVADAIGIDVSEVYLPKAPKNW